MTLVWNVTGKYRDNAAYVRVKGAIINPQNGSRAPINFECKVDTGCTFGLYFEESLRSDAEIVGVTPFPTKIRLGDGSKVPAYTCVAHIEEIDSFRLPPPGLKVTLYMRGVRMGYIGMEALKSCITQFDGHAQEFKMRF